jgi:hypothetical protein
MKNHSSRRNQESIFLRVPIGMKQRLQMRANRENLTLTDFLIQSLEGDGMNRKGGLSPGLRHLFAVLNGSKGENSPWYGAIEMTFTHLSFGSEPRLIARRIVLVHETQKDRRLRYQARRHIQELAADRGLDPLRSFFQFHLEAFPDVQASGTMEPLWLELALTGKVLWSTRPELIDFLLDLRIRIAQGEFRRTADAGGLRWKRVNST